MKSIIVTIAALVISSSVVFAQYDFAIGLRTGGTSGITIKKNYGKSAIEGIAGFWHDGFSATSIWTRNTTAFSQPHLNFYYGVGGHLSIYGDRFNTKSGISWYSHPRGYQDGGFGLGIDGTIGIEYKIKDAPIAFSFDLKPYLEILNGGDVIYATDPGLGIKVAF